MDKDVVKIAKNMKPPNPNDNSNSHEEFKVDDYLAKGGQLDLIERNKIKERIKKLEQVKE